jgi:hypothetical protein
VRTGNAERLGLGTDRRQHLGPSQDGDARTRRFVELDVPRRNRCRGSHGLAALDMSAIVTYVHLDSRGTHPLEDRPITKVTTADLMAHLGQDDGNGAHARPAYADHVQPVWRREIKCYLGWVDHGAAIRSIRSTSAPLR